MNNTDKIQVVLLLFLYWLYKNTGTIKIIEAISPYKSTNNIFWIPNIAPRAPATYVSASPMAQTKTKIYPSLAIISRITAPAINPNTELITPSMPV